MGADFGVTFWIAQVMGGLALIATVWSMLLNKRKSVMVLQTASELMFVLQYILLDAWSGACLAMISMIRDTIFLKYGKKRAPGFWMLIIIVAMTVVSVITWKGSMSLLPYAGSIIYALCLWYGDVSLIRFGNVAGNSFYCVYQWMTMAYAGVIATVIEMASAVVGMVKYDRGNFAKLRKRLFERKKRRR